MDQIFNPFTYDIFLSMSEGLNAVDKDSLPFQIEEGLCKTYYPNHCQTCYSMGSKENPLKLCSRCHLVSYCGKEHQGQDYKKHKDLCKVLFKLGGPRLFEDLKRTSALENISFQTKVELSSRRSILRDEILSQIMTKLNRKPFLCELQMVTFPRVCAVCYESDPTLLRRCTNCPQSSFCVQHEKDKSHSKYCAGFNLAHKIDVDIIGGTCFELEKTELKTFTLPCQKRGSLLPSSMKDFIKNNSCLKVRRNTRLEGMLSQQLWEVYLSESICLPLTLLYAMEKLKFQVQSNLVIHVVGSSPHEMQSNIWELILHWLPTVTKLDIVFIGPELRFFSPLDKETTPVQTCNDCKGRELNFHTFDGLYQNYDSSENYLKPNILAAFNAGFHAYSTWIEAFKKMAALHCPLILTAYSYLEALDDHECFKNVVSGAEYFSQEENPFAGLRCQRYLVEPKVYVNNQYLTIYDSL